MTLARSILLPFLALALAGPASAQEEIPEIERNGWRLPPSILEAEVDLETIRVDEKTRSLIARLTADNYRDREQATLGLLDKSVSTNSIYKVLIDEPIGIEQRYRLLRVLQRKILNSPRGALGIEMELPVRGGGVVVKRTIENMPAGEVLRVGDEIVQIEGQPITRQGDLIMLVQSRPPGTPIDLKIRRRDINPQGQPEVTELNVTIRLGSIEGLRDPETGLVRTSPEWDRRVRDYWRFAEREYAPRARVVQVRVSSLDG